MVDKKKEKPKTKILAVDDEEAVVLLLHEFFSRRNYEVIKAYSGKEAIELVKKEKPQVVLLDIRMEDMSGLDVLKAIREIDKDVRILMLSALDDMDTISKARQLGADDYIPKPMSMQYLEDVVLKTLTVLKVKDYKKTTEGESSE